MKTRARRALVASEILALSLGAMACGKAGTDRDASARRTFSRAPISADSNTQPVETSRVDPVTFLLVAAVLVAVAMAANLLPARRAAQVEPMRVLRES